MGCFKMSVGQYGISNNVPVAPGNPNPRNFRVLLAEQVGAHVVARIHYPDCRNFEGIKVLLFRDTSALRLYQTAFIDPHFTDEDVLKPIARFEPTEEGWRLALMSALNLP